MLGQVLPSGSASELAGRPWGGCVLLQQLLLLLLARAGQPARASVLLTRQQQVMLGQALPRGSGRGETAGDLKGGRVLLQQRLLVKEGQSPCAADALAVGKKAWGQNAVLLLLLQLASSGQQQAARQKEGG